MDASLRKFPSCHLHTAITRKKKKDFGEMQIIGKKLRLNLVFFKTA